MNIPTVSKSTGVKRPFKLDEIWRIRTRLELEHNWMQIALLNLAIDSKMRACDLLNLHIHDVCVQNVVLKLLLNHINSPSFI